MPLKIKITTTFNKRLWDEYVSKIFEKSVKNWEGIAHWDVWVDEFFPELPELPNVTYFRLDDDKARANFLEFAKTVPQPKGADYRFDVVKFCHKVFAIYNSFVKNDFDYLVFLGADVETHTQVTSDFEKSLETVVVHLGRKDINYSETDFLAFKNCEAAGSFINDWRGNYISHEVFNQAQWTDAYVFERLLFMHKAHGLDTRSLSEGLPGLNVFEHTVLGNWMHHFKGPGGKQILSKGESVGRYGIVQQLIDYYKPERFTGPALFKHTPGAKDWMAFTKDMEEAKALVKAGADIVVIDGITAVTDDLKALGASMLPSDDVNAKGEPVHCAFVKKPHLGAPQIKVPLRVTPKDCVEKSWIYENIDKNLKLISTWLEKVQVHGLEANIVSGGPSLEKIGIPILREKMKKPNRVFCVKHSLPVLVKAGIVPYGCVVLDPRELSGVSTHGFVRKDLFSNLPKETYYFIASMTHPSVTEYLLEQGVKLIGWHAYSDSAAKYALPKNSFWITGGTCSALRTIQMSHVLGFRKMNLIGFDLAVEEPPPEKLKEVDEQGRPKVFSIEIGKRQRKFWSTGELVAAIQNVDEMCQTYMNSDFELDILGDGAAYEIWTQAERPKRKTLYEAFP